MKFNADLLKKVLDAKVLPEKHGQVICAEFISFAHSQNTVTRHSAKVCPHSSESIIETKYTIEGDALEQLRFIFTPKNLNILYVEGKWKEKHYLLKLDSTHKKLKSYQDYKKGKAWLVRDYVLYQKTPDEILFFALDGRSHSIDTGVFDLINALVVGSTESGDLWLPNHTCRHMKQTGTEYNIVVEKCPKPEKLLLSFSALKRLDAGLADDEAVSNFFALLYYEKAPVTKKVDTKTTIAGSETTLSPVTEEDIPLDEAYLETTLLPTEASEVSSDVCVEPSPWNNVWSFWIPTVLACILFLSTMIFFGLCRREYKKRKEAETSFCKHVQFNECQLKTKKGGDEKELEEKTCDGSVSTKTGRLFSFKTAKSKKSAKTNKNQTAKEKPFTLVGICKELDDKEKKAAHN